MVDITAEKMNIMPYQEQQKILMPSSISLDGDFLFWEAENMPPDDRRGETGWMLCSTKGCLEDFVALANADAAHILNFARARGVLGLYPLVSKKEDYLFGYREPLEPYRQLAGRMRDILSMIRLLREGEQPDEANLPGNSILQDVPDVGWRSWYKYLWRQVGIYWKIANIGMTLAGFEASSEGLSLAAPSGVLMQFGGWLQGTNWDDKQALLTRAGNTIVVPGIEIEQLVAQGMYADEAEEYREALFQRGYRETASGECVAPYSEYSKSVYRRLGLEGSRPSALLNILAFKLLRRVLLPEGTYFCHYERCGRAYVYDEDKALNDGKLPKGKDSKEWGNSKPRRDRPACFCCHYCRHQHDLERRGQRYHARER